MKEGKTYRFPILPNPLTIPIAAARLEGGRGTAGLYAFPEGPVQGVTGPRFGAAAAWRRCQSFSLARLRSGEGALSVIRRSGAELWISAFFGQSLFSVIHLCPVFHGDGRSFVNCAVIVRCCVKVLWVVQRYCGL